MKNVLTILKKEFNRLFKDKRMVLMLFLPGVLIFLLYTLIGTMTEKVNPSVEKDYKPTAYIVSIPEELEQAFGEMFELKTFESFDVAKENVAAGELDLVINFPENFLNTAPAEASAEVQPEVKIYYNSSSQTSSYGFALASACINSFNAFGINTSPDGGYDLMDAENFSVNILSMIVPMIMFSLLASASISVAPESIAGEKERGTMATMLITPVKRIEIVLGKVISLSCFAIISGFSSFLGLILSLPELSGGMFELSSFAYGVGDYFMLFGLVISIGLVMITAFSVISTLAKNVKESSAFISPLMIVIILLGMCTMFFKNPSVWIHLVPFLGSGIAMSSVIGMTASPLGVVLAIVSNLVFAVLLTLLMGLMFKKENIMLKK